MSLLNSFGAQAAIPSALRERAQEHLDQLAQQVPETLEQLAAGPLVEPFLVTLMTSEYFAHTIQRQPHFLAQLLERGWVASPRLDENWLSLKVLPGATETENLSALRQQRHLHMLRILWRENGGIATLDDTLSDLSMLAAQQIASAEGMSRAALVMRFGEPDNDRLCVLAMGKLGGGELNLSSDVDLVFVHGQDGESQGERQTSNAEFFARQVRGLVDLLSRNTADGFCYRTDTRLRPFGQSGRPVVSLNGLEHYLLVHGREWERYAYIKARALTGCDDQHQELQDILRPFVYRRYLDFGVFESLRDMKAMIEREVRSKELQHNIKRGAGGIREIEFIVQTLQLVYGGKRFGLQQTGFYAALNALVTENCLPQQTASELRDDYDLLRRVENGVQGIRDQQVHSLPLDSLDQQRLVLLMRANSWPELAARIERARERVHTYFNDISAVVPATTTAQSVGLSNATTAASADTPTKVQAASEAEPWYLHSFSNALQPLAALAAGGLRDRLETYGRARLDALMPVVIKELEGMSDATAATTRLVTLIEAIGRRSAYFSLLTENPHVLHRVINICASSAELASRLARTPVLLDSLVDPRGSSMGLTAEGLRERFAHHVSTLDRLDEELGLLAVRDFRQSAMFDVAVADMERHLPVMKISDRLTDIAQLILTEAWRQSSAQMEQRFGQPRRADNGELARFAVLGYGKLGGLELSYSSDLDLVFLYDDGGAGQTDGEKSVDNALYFARLAQRLIHILTVPTAMGAAYEVDMRLRPSGKSGLLISRFDAFIEYQRERAWTWEHQALLRARAVAGNHELMQDFEKFRVDLIASRRETRELADAVFTMRQKMRAHLDQSDEQQFNLKHGLGGLVDIEFLVQFLVLAGAADNPELARWSDNVRQLEALATCNCLSSEEAERLTQIYLSYRQKLHEHALTGAGAMVSNGLFGAERAWVAELYQRKMAPPEGL